MLAAELLKLESGKVIPFDKEQNRLDQAIYGFRPS